MPVGSSQVADSNGSQPQSAHDLLKVRGKVGVVGNRLGDRNDVLLGLRAQCAVVLVGDGVEQRADDPAIQLVPGSVCPDVTLDVDSFSRVEFAVKRVFITENETNFLAFPQIRDAIVIFGAGYGWDALARSHWLKNCPIHYWGTGATLIPMVLASLISCVATLHTWIHS